MQAMSGGDSGQAAMTGEHGLLAAMLAPLMAWQERRFVARCCRQLLRIYQAAAAEHPDLARAELYQRVVVAHTGIDPAGAGAILEGARESFALWPVSRGLSLRDVAHYLAVSEFLATHGKSRWIHANLKRVVAASIPHDL